MFLTVVHWVEPALSLLQSRDLEMSICVQRVLSLFLPLVQLYEPHNPFS